jgi:lipopolysaccharide/colanic/teichoic acid biosynthesis glycosyltransferase
MGSRTHRSDVDGFPKQEQMRRFSLLPGSTGRSQGSGSSATTNEQPIRFGLEFARRRSPCLELEIPVRAVPTVFGVKEAC